MTAFTQPGSYTYVVPSGVSLLYVDLWGAGGGGAASAANATYSGGGGGAGGRAVGYVPVTAGMTCTITVGQGGFGAGMFGQNGGSGTASAVTCGSAGLSAAGGSGGNANGSGGFGGSNDQTTGAVDLIDRIAGPNGGTGTMTAGGGTYAGLVLQFANGGQGISPSGSGNGYLTQPGLPGFVILVPVL
jgi:hypothetical protein